MGIKHCKISIFYFFIILNLIIIDVVWATGNGINNECSEGAQAKEESIKEECYKYKYYLNEILYFLYKNNKTSQSIWLDETLSAYGFYPVNKRCEDFTCFLCGHIISCNSYKSFIEIRKLLENKTSRSTLHTRVCGKDCHFVDLDDENRSYNMSKEEIEKLNYLLAGFCGYPSEYESTIIGYPFLYEDKIELINYDHINFIKRKLYGFVPESASSNKLIESNSTKSKQVYPACQLISSLSLYVEEGKKFCLTNEVGCHSKKKEDINKEVAIYSTLEQRINSYSECANKECNVELMARAGFYFNKKYSVCYCCGGSIESVDDEVPWVKHARLYPQCKFLNESMGKEFVDNIQTIFGLVGKEATLKEVQEVLNALHLYKRV
ncbi:MAG: hypothetical protein KAG14_05170, partial [Mycoplasmataceae bacterium]|nr:hypothetical protein [Mycoplasmataceae bacterium]